LWISPFWCKDGQNSSCSSADENAFIIINIYDFGMSFKIFYLPFPAAYSNFADAKTIKSQSWYESIINEQHEVIYQIFKLLSFSIT
jgi:hypothetical protein